MTSRTSNYCPLGGFTAEPWPLKDWPFASSWTLTSLAFHDPGCNFSTYSVLIARFSSKSLFCLETTAIMAEDCHPPLTAIFTPPAICTNGYSFAGMYPDIHGSTRPVIEATLSQSSSCFAPGWTSAANPSAKGGNFWLGPPLCPSGQTIAETVTDADMMTTAVCCSR
jgi:hypothetical protein